MVLKKKGVFFTLLGVMLSVMLIGVFFSHSPLYASKEQAKSTRILSVNAFISDIEQDFSRALYIAGYRSVLSLNTHIRDQENYISDLDSVFTEIIINGTVNGSVINLMQQDGIGADLTSWLERVNEQSNTIGIEAQIYFGDVTIEQTGPWYITIGVNTTMLIEDNDDLARWNFSHNYNVTISILGFEDPLYIVGTDDKLTNIINVTNITDFVTQPGNVTTNLQSHIADSYYIASSYAPSFLMRFSGNLSPSPAGIESIVSVERLSAQSILVLKRSLVDYLYFGNQTTTGLGLDLCNVTNMPAWFRFHSDAAHQAVYQIDDLDGISC